MYACFSCPSLYASDPHMSTPPHTPPSRRSTKYKTQISGLPFCCPHALCKHHNNSQQHHHDRPASRSLAVCHCVFTSGREYRIPCCSCLHAAPVWPRLPHAAAAPHAVPAAGGAVWRILIVILRVAWWWRRRRRRAFGVLKCSAASSAYSEKMKVVKVKVSVSRVVAAFHCSLHILSVRG